MYETRQNGERSFYGVEFHLKKQRKIDRIKETLDALKIEYKETFQSDGTTKIRAYNQFDTNIVCDLLERWLHNNGFTWRWLELSPEQAAFFIEEIQLWDGCAAANLYTSKNRENLEIVSAIAALNGVGSRVSGDNVLFRESPYITLSTETKRHVKQSAPKKTEVTCISVKTGMFIARQYGRPFVIGNCPGPYLHDRLASGQIEKDIMSAMGKPSTGKLYRVQVGAFKSLPNADKFAETMRAIGEKTIIVQADGLYKVQVGAYSSKANAERHVERLKAGGYSAFII